MRRINHPDNPNLWFMGAGQYLREARNKHAITLNQAARTLCVEPASLSRYENNKTSFSLEFLAQFCRTLGENFPEILQKCLEEIIDNTNYQEKEEKAGTTPDTTDYHQVSGS